MQKVRLTQYSHGSGCGCKLSPAVLETILDQIALSGGQSDYPQLLTGNSGREDSAALELPDGSVLLSTTDFFMPIVDDPYQFGQIAAANAISDIYAMGGRPILALGLLGWPIDKLDATIAAEVLCGARDIAASIGMPLAGGHSIDSPEPIFGLAVNGIVSKNNLKQNNTPQIGDLLYLTKSLGIGILATAEKKSLLAKSDIGVAATEMIRLNTIGERVAGLSELHAMTDVTGFALLGHLCEMCAGSIDRNLADVSVGARTPLFQARIDFDALSLLADLERYVHLGAVPGGAKRNWESYGAKVDQSIEESRRHILCDPQTSGGLLLAVDPSAQNEIEEILRGEGLGRHARPIGTIVARGSDEQPLVVINR